MADTAEPLRPSGPGLTKQQIKILLAIRNLARDHDGRPPSMREVARALGRKSAGGLGYQYAILEATGFLRRESGGGPGRKERPAGAPSFVARWGESPRRRPPGPKAGAPPAGPGRETVVWV